MLRCMLRVPLDILCGDYAAANAQLDELIALAEEKGARSGRRSGTLVQGCVLAADRQRLRTQFNMITSGIAA